MDIAINVWSSSEKVIRIRETCRHLAQSAGLYFYAFILDQGGLLL
jgi:hypothetical protein